mmetsp:Transcript_137456/g.439150  ORF Transcript_137456/g.439150 Transcript_137456/m.439150 type:complete len:242 (+) Transcript_137456:1117-1842(+)
MRTGARRQMPRRGEARRGPPRRAARRRATSPGPLRSPTRPRPASAGSRRRHRPAAPRPGRRRASAASAAWPSACAAAKTSPLWPLRHRSRRHTSTPPTKRQWSRIALPLSTRAAHTSSLRAAPPKSSRCPTVARPSTHLRPAPPWKAPGRQSRPNGRIAACLAAPSSAPPGLQGPPPRVGQTAARPGRGAMLRPPPRQHPPSRGTRRRARRAESPRASLPTRPQEGSATGRRCRRGHRRSH